MLRRPIEFALATIISMVVTATIQFMRVSSITVLGMMKFMVGMVTIASVEEEGMTSSEAVLVMIHLSANMILTNCLVRRATINSSYSGEKMSSRGVREPIR